MAGMKQIQLSPRARIASAIAASAGLLLMASACGGSPSSTGRAGGSANSPLLAYAGCMRSHGVPNFPDPGGNGAIPKMTSQQLGVSDSQFQAAQGACAHLLQPTEAEVAQVMSGMLDFARCMRSHGVPNWPDPTTSHGAGSAPGTDGSPGQPLFEIPGIDPMSPQVSNAADACSHLLHQSTTGPTTILLCDGVGEDGRCHGYGNPNS
jgi:hypothetical protein